MNHCRRTHIGVSIIAMVSTAGLLSACATREPPPDYNAPPTVRESLVLGVDAEDSYFLNRYRRCIQWKSEQICREEPYGDDSGGFE